jgi:hypothetical protein
MSSCPEAYRPKHILSGNYWSIYKGESGKSSPDSHQKKNWIISGLNFCYHFKLRLFKANFND